MLPDAELASKIAKKTYLRKISTLVADNHVIDQHRNEQMRHSVEIIQHEIAARQQDHHIADSSAGPLVAEKHLHMTVNLGETMKQSIDPLLLLTPLQLVCWSLIQLLMSTKEMLARLSHQKALFDYGMLILNFWDGISEGNGDRALRC